MKTEFTLERFNELFGKRFASHSVLGSLGMLSAADQPWRDIKGGLDLFGYPKPLSPCKQK